MLSLRVVVVVLLTATAMFAQQIPPGTALPVVLTSTLDAKKNRPGQEISARIKQDVPLPGGQITAGARVLGRILQVQAATAGAGSQVTFIFDRVHKKDADIPVTTSLRAIASMVAVKDAQLPTRSPARSEPPATWTTVQVGEDVVYRGGGHVMHGDRIVGEAVYNGVLYDGVVGELSSPNGKRCVGDAPGRNFALWVFSSSACGAYGFDDLRITNAGNGSAAGQITLHSETNVYVHSGAGLLLIAYPAVR